MTDENKHVNRAGATDHRTFRLDAEESRDGYDTGHPEHQKLSGKRMTVSK